MIVWSISAGIMTVAVLFGIQRMLGDLRHWRADLGRSKAPWEREV